MTVRGVCGGLMNLFGAIALVLSVWAAIFTAFFVGRSVVVMVHAGGYRPATFTVEELLFQKGVMRTNRTYDSHGAVGTVDGRRERFGLGGYVKLPLQSRADLEGQVRVGQQLPVLYNPAVPKSSEARVLYPEKNFKQTWQRRQREMITTAYLPWGLAIALCLVFGAAAGRIASAVKICLGACVLVVLAWIPALVQLFF